MFEFYLSSWNVVYFTKKDCKPNFTMATSVKYPIRKYELYDFNGLDALLYNINFLLNDYINYPLIIIQIAKQITITIKLLTQQATRDSRAALTGRKIPKS